MNAQPERAEGDKSKARVLTRLEEYRKQEQRAGNAAWEDHMPELPPVHVARHVLGYLYEIGPAMAGGAGPAPVTQQEIAAWQANTGIRLTAWEVKAIRRLSCEYVAEKAKAEKRDCPEPAKERGPQDAKAAAAKRLRDEMRALAR